MSASNFFAVSVLAREGERTWHWLESIRATDPDHAEAEGAIAFLVAHPKAEVRSVLVTEDPRQARRRSAAE